MLSLRKTLSILYTECERCAAFVSGLSTNLFMQNATNATTRPQKFFGRFKKPLVEMPNFVEPQLESFRWLIEKGLKEVFEEFSSIKDYSEKKFTLDFTGFELAQAKREVVVYQRQLAKEIGFKEFKPISVKEDFVIRDVVKVKPDFEAWIKNNPSLLQAAAKTNAAAFSLKSSYANFFPEISADAGANRRGSRWPARKRPSSRGRKRNARKPG